MCLVTQVLKLDTYVSVHVVVGQWLRCDFSDVGLGLTDELHNNRMDHVHVGSNSCMKSQCICT